MKTYHEGLTTEDYKILDGIYERTKAVQATTGGDTLHARLELERLKDVDAQVEQQFTLRL